MTTTKQGVCGDEERLLGAAVLAVFALPLVATMLVVVLAHGCAGGSHAVAAVDLAAPSVVAGGTISYDSFATPAQVAAGTPYVARYLAHWGPLAGRQLAVRVVRDGTYPSRGFRDRGLGVATVSYGPDGVVYAVEWEVPLLAQGVNDPATWTWGAWGPLYDGQDPRFVAATKGTP